MVELPKDEPRRAADVEIGHVRKAIDDLGHETRSLSAEVRAGMSAASVALTEIRGDIKAAKDLTEERLKGVDRRLSLLERVLYGGAAVISGALLMQWLNGLFKAAGP